MAKADEIREPDCSADALVWAADVLKMRFEEIVRLRAAALMSDDIEAVHDMRVATRRLRSALRDFAPLLKKNPLKKISKDLKNLADTLGAARDEDVAIAALEKLRAKADAETVKEGITKLICERRAVRQGAAFPLMDALTVSAFEALQKRFNDALDAAVPHDDSAKNISFTEAGRAAIGKSLDEFCELSAALYAPFRVKELHELRIAAKRLRYAVELFTACRGEQIAPFAKEIAEMQTFLGEIHDADIWIEGITKRLPKNGGVEIQTHLWLMSEFVKERTKNYRGALQLWGRWEADGFVEKLRAAISR